MKKIIILFLFIVSRFSIADEVSVQQLQEILKLHPSENLKGTAIKLMPTYEIGSGSFNYDFSKSIFHFEYKSGISNQSAIFDYTNDQGLIAKYSNSKAQSETFKLIPESTLFSKVFGGWFVNYWMAQADIKNNIEGDFHTFNINFKRQSYMTDLSLTYLDNKLQWANLNCTNKTSYLFTLENNSSQISQN
jgi:hypothetical protein